MALYTANEIKNWDVSTPNQKDEWVPMRPDYVGWNGFFARLKQGWKVFTGKYDAVNWQQETYKNL